MAFVTEDGTGLSTANSYGAVADADAYFVDKGIGSTWAADNAKKQSALIQGTQFLDLMYGMQLSGYREVKSPMQALQFPRLECYTVEGLAVVGVPLGWKQACYELAYLSTTLNLFQNSIADSSGREIDTTEITVGPITRKKKVLPDVSVNRFQIVELLVSQYLTSRNSNRVVV